MTEVKLFSVSVNKRRPYCICTSGSDSDYFVVIGMSPSAYQISSKSDYLCLRYDVKMSAVRHVEFGVGKL